MIAISYRRDDSLPVTGRLYDRLQAEFGKGNVFMDFDSIPYGVDFRDHIKQVIGKSRLLVAVIGPDWVGKRRHRTRRIDDPADFVRLEVGYALELGLPVIPVLINDTLMPSVRDLPGEIEALAFRNALILDAGIDFHHHVDRLISGINRLLMASAGSAPSAAKDQARELIKPVEASPSAGETPIVAPVPSALSEAKTPPPLPPKPNEPEVTEKPRAEATIIPPSEPSKRLAQAAPPGVLQRSKDQPPPVPADEAPVRFVRLPDGERRQLAAGFFRWDRKRIFLLGAACLLILAVAAAAWRWGVRHPESVVAAMNPSVTPAPPPVLATTPTIAPVPRSTRLPTLEATPSARVRARGALMIDSTPPGVAYEVNDGDRIRHTGITPATIKDLPAGPTSITYKSGVLEHHETLWIESSKTSSSTWSVPRPSPSVAKATSTPSPPSVPAWHTQMEELVRGFVESNESADVNRAASFYASEADIFEEGRKNQEAIRHDIQTYNDRWPVRRDSIRDDIQLEEKVRGQEYGASFHQEYYVESPGRHEWLKGESVVDLRINLFAGTPKIVSIKQKVLSREKGTGKGPGLAASAGMQGSPTGAVPGPAVPQSASQGLVRVVNKTYGFSALIPAEVFPDAARPSDTDRTAFSSANGRTTLNLLARQNTDGTAFNRLYQDWIAEHTQARPNKKVHYKVLKDSWFVVSGIEGERGFYVKGVKKGNLVVLMSLDYDENASPLQTETLLVMSRSFDGN